LLLTSPIFQNLLTIMLMRQMVIPSLLSLFTVVFLSSVSSAQIITTVAGCGIGDDSLATRAELGGPVAVCVDTAGNTYIAEQDIYRVRKIDPAGVITTIAGNGSFGHTGDGGPATAASIGGIYGVAKDRTGNIYIAEERFNCIRKIDLSGIITTIAGTGYAGFSGDHGPAITAQLNNPTDIIVDTSGNIIFADWLNSRVRKIDPAGIITTIVGDGATGGSGDGGPATASELGRPFRVTMDNKGNLYVASVLFQCICKVDPAGIIHLIGGTGAYGLGADGDGGPATAATMTSPCGLAVDTSGNLYFSDISNYRIRKIDMNAGIISNYAANGIAGYGGDGGPSTAAKIGNPEGLACDKYGNVLICDPSNNLVRKASVSGTMTTFAGQTGLFGDGNDAVNAELNYPENLVTDASGNIYIADIGANRVRMINTSGIITTIAGNGVAGYSGDGGPATSAGLYYPSALAFDHSGNLYICDQGNERIRVVNSSGIIRSITSGGAAGFAGDGGPAIYAKFHFPTGIAIDAAGNIFICDNNNHRIRKINTSGIINTIAGTGVVGYSGDGGQATDAALAYPADVSVDGRGNLYICDGGNSSIRMVDTAGIITTVAGNGTAGFSGDDGLAISAQLHYPYGIRSDSAGNIFISDHENERIRMVTADGFISTVAGNGTPGFSGDGGAPFSAMLNAPSGVALDLQGNLFIADAANSRIRKVNLSILAVPSAAANSTDILVYPNPSTGIVNISNAANSTLTLLDMPGKEVMKRAIVSDKQTISIAGLANGVYILRLVNDRGDKKIMKLVKE
jgi:trimeric autotransporter adhesin